MATTVPGCDESRNDPDHPASESEYRKQAIDDVFFLASDRLKGRETGTQGAYLASKYIEKRMESLGLHPAFDSGYRFDFPAGSVVLQEDPKGRASSLQINKETTDSHPSSVPGISGESRILPLPLFRRGEAEGNLVSGGYCIESEHYDDISEIRDRIKDAIVLCHRYGPEGPEDQKLGLHMSFQKKGEVLVEYGAKGIVFIGTEQSDPPHIRFLESKEPLPIPAVFVSPGPLLKILPSRFPIIDRNNKDESFFYPPGSIPARMKIESRYRIVERTGTNLAGYLFRPHMNDRITVIGAHYDHIGMGASPGPLKNGWIHNGADDNASGIAALLQTADRLKRTIALDQDPNGYSHGKRNILFVAFDGEESGLLGSLSWTTSTYFSRERTIAMINLDMVGRLRKSRGLYLQGIDSADPLWKSMLVERYQESRAGSSGYPLQLLPGLSGPSDHASFSREKIPFAYLYTGGHQHYHRPEDRAETLNYTGISHVSQYVSMIAKELHQAASLPTFRSGGPERLRRTLFQLNGGFRGAFYDAHMGQGVEIASLPGGSSLQRAGLKKGDRIVSIEKIPIRGTEDLNYRLDLLPFGRPIQIGFFRDRTRKTASAYLESLPDP